MRVTSLSSAAFTATRSISTSRSTTKTTSLRSLIDLYHASAQFPSNTNLQDRVDTELLERDGSTVPHAKGWYDVENEARKMTSNTRTALEKAKDARDILQTDMRKRELAERQLAEDLVMHANPESKQFEADLSQRDKLQRHRLLQVMDALHGTSQATNAGLEIVEERKGEL